MKCKKCTGDEYHNLHLTKREKEWDQIATAMLEQLKGFLNRD